MAGKKVVVIDVKVKDGEISFRGQPLADGQEIWLEETYGHWAREGTDLVRYSESGKEMHRLVMVRDGFYHSGPQFGHWQPFPLKNLSVEEVCNLLAEQGIYCYPDPAGWNKGAGSIALIWEGMRDSDGRPLSFHYTHDRFLNLFGEEWVEGKLVFLGHRPFVAVKKYPIFGEGGGFYRMWCYHRMVDPEAPHYVTDLGAVGWWGHGLFSIGCNVHTHPLVEYDCPKCAAKPLWAGQSLVFTPEQIVTIREGLKKGLALIEIQEILRPVDTLHPYHREARRNTLKLTQKVRAYQQSN